MEVSYNYCHEVLKSRWNCDWVAFESWTKKKIIWTSANAIEKNKWNGDANARKIQNGWLESESGLAICVKDCNTGTDMKVIQWRSIIVVVCVWRHIAWANLANRTIHTWKISAYCTCGCAIRKKNCGLSLDRSMWRLMIDLNHLVHLVVVPNEAVKDQNKMCFCSYDRSPVMVIS